MRLSEGMNEWDIKGSVRERKRERVSHCHTACGFVAMVTVSRQAVYNLRETAVIESPSDSTVLTFSPPFSAENAAFSCPLIPFVFPNSTHYQLNCFCCQV